MTVNASNAALSAAYVFKGFKEHCTPVVWRAAYEDIGEGEIALMGWLSEWGVEIEKTWMRMSEGREANGVWDYEVSEPLGDWIRQHVAINNRMPSFNETQTKLGELVDQYWGGTGHLNEGCQSSLPAPLEEVWVEVEAPTWNIEALPNPDAAPRIGNTDDYVEVWPTRFVFNAMSQGDIERCPKKYASQWSVYVGRPGSFRCLEDFACTDSCSLNSAVAYATTYAQSHGNLHVYVYNQ